MSFIKFLSHHVFTLIFAMLGLWINHAQATCGAVSGATATISAPQTSQCNMTANMNLVITAPGSIGSPAFYGAYISDLSASSIVNSGAIATAYGGVRTYDTTGTTYLGSITNNIGGSISSGYAGIWVYGGRIGSIGNSGTIASGNPSSYGGITLTNLGVPSSSVITSIANMSSGVISGAGGSYAIGLDANTEIGTITNIGEISGGSTAAISNNGSLGILNNGQGAGSSAGALTYSGILPTNYKIIINSAVSYGQLSVSSTTGSMAFGIYAGGVSGVSASVLGAGRYLNVLQGFTTLGSVSGTTGTYLGFNYSLVADASTLDAWDLLVALAGPSAADTQQSLVNTASALQNTYTLQNSVLANSFSYDCNVFGANNVCISAGGRNTAVSAANGLNNTSALLIAAYRPHPNYRIGAYADQNLSVNNAGSTVNLGNNTPLIGLFGAWNEKQDGVGAEVKVTAAYGQKNTTITRQVVGASEAGSGSSQLNSQGAQATVKYGFGVMPDVVVSPYAGIRYTQNNMGGYTEATSSTVTAPLTYSALNTNATTALAGVGAAYRGIPKTTLMASAGVESDTNTSNGSYSATGVSGLTPINFNANPVKTRPTATIGAYYDIEKNQRLGITGIYRQEAYQAVQTTTVMATYTVGL